MKIKYLLVLSFFIFIFGLTYVMQNQNYETIEIQKKQELPPKIKQEIKKQEIIKKDLEYKNTKYKETIYQKDINEIELDTWSTDSIEEPKNSNEIKNKKSTWDNLYIIDKLDYISNIDNLLKFSWDNLEKIDKIKIWDDLYIPYISNWSLFVLVENSKSYNWDYSIIFILKNWEEISLEKKVNFSFNNDIFIVTNITPKILKNDIVRNIVLQWEGFNKIISIQLSNNIVLKATSFNIINDNVLIIKIPEWLEIWKYSLNIMGTQGIFTPNIQITIKK